MKAIKIISVLLLIVAFTSCKTKRMAGKSLASQKTVSELLDKDYPAQTLSSQLNLDAGGFSLNGDLRIVKDQAIYIQVKAFLGIEVARIRITPDSLIAVDRINRRYFADSFSRIKDWKEKGLNFFTLQSLLTNRIFLNTKEKISHKNLDDFTLKANGKNTQLIQKDDPDCFFEVNNDSQLSQTVLGDRSGKFKLNWAYSSFDAVNDYSFPHEMGITISTPKRKISSTMQLSRVEFGKKLNVDLNIPSRYNRVDIDDILKLFTNL
jgi:hypothetical protein